MSRARDDVESRRPAHKTPAPACVPERPALHRLRDERGPGGLQPHSAQAGHHVRQRRPRRV